MAIFNVNQNRQFYVVNEVVTTEPSKEGQLKMGKTQDEKQIFFNHYGKGGLTRTDLIDVDKVCYVKVTPKSDMRRNLKKAVVTLSEDVNEGNPIVGQDYILRIQVNNYLSPGDASVLIRSGNVRAMKGMDATAFYKAMASSLTMNFERDVKNHLPRLLKFEGDASGVTITEVDEQPWRLGLLSKEPVNFEVIPTTVSLDGSEVIWGETEYSESSDFVGNGTQVADLEYFCMAERGDMFRNMGYPNNIDVKMMVDPTKEYDIIDLHFYFSGNGVQVHKSEKDITFVSDKTDVVNSIKTALTGVGITVTE